MFYFPASKTPGTIAYMFPDEENEEIDLILHVLFMTTDHNERGQTMATDCVFLKDKVPEIPLKIQ